MRAPKNRRATARRMTQLEDEQNPPPSVRQRRLGFRAKVALALGSLVLMLSALEVAVRLTTSFLNQERGMTFDRELGWRPCPTCARSARCGA